MTMISKTFHYSCLSVLLVIVLGVVPPPVVAWLPATTTSKRARFHSLLLSSTTSTRLESSSEDQETTPAVDDYTGKTLYQRTFYRLSPGSQVAVPNALVLEERLRFQADPNNPGYMLPFGPRTVIFREGTSEDEITKEIYRVQVPDGLGGSSGNHNGSGTMDTTLATILYLASNPHLVQGDVLQLACENGAAGLLGCVGARFAMDPQYNDKSSDGGENNNDNEVLRVPGSGQHKKDVFPPRLHRLVLSDEGENRLAYDVAKPFPSDLVGLKEVRWSTRIPGRRYEHYYRLVLGSDIDFNYPNSKELARTIANYLLPSNEFAVMSLKDGVSQTSGAGAGGGSFGAMGMDFETPSAPSSTGNDRAEIDSNVPATFVHVCPDVRETTTYLRQFLEKGFRMTVSSQYLKMERLQFVVQTLPVEAPESDLEDLDTLELQEESSRSYQSLIAVHHPDYSGDGTGEYFFPLETGEYEAGSRNTYLEPEEGGAPW